MPGGGKTYASYRDYRAAIGRETRFVNLRLTGQLQNDWRAGLRRVSATEWEAEPKRIRNKNISLKAQNKYEKDIFYPSKKEKETLTKTFESELNKLYGK